MVGLMNVLHHEGARDDIRVNTLAPTAATRMTEQLLPEVALDLLKPETITPGLLYLVSKDAPSKTILSAGAGVFAQTRVYETQGVLIEGDITPEAVAAHGAQLPTPQIKKSYRTPSPKPANTPNAPPRRKTSNWIGKLIPLHFAR